MAYVISFFLVQFFLASYTKRNLSSLVPLQNDALLFYLGLGILVGGRLGYCLLYNWDQFTANPLVFFQIWRGGMASHGGFIGGILAILYFSRKSRCNPWIIGDIVCSIIPLCLMIGRCGNFINAELVGRVTEVPWGVVFERGGTLGLAVRHPSQLYEAFFEGSLPFIVLQILIRRKNNAPGYLSSLFLVLYAVGRIGCEFFREPDAGLILGMTRGQFWSIFLLIFGIILMLAKRNVRRSLPKLN
jgi:phosphatidylglycerol:prolipoprotein diacylglycerol transferase